MMKQQGHYFHFYSTAATLLVLCSSTMPSVQAQDCSSSSSGNGAISFVGASRANDLTNAWVEAWGCLGVTVVVEDGGSSAGISRVCGTTQGSEAADIGGMTRMPFVSEAGTEDGWNYKCERSARNLIGIEVAVDGVSIAVSQGLTDENGGSFNKKSVALDCINELEGLTFPQLRWMFSSFSDDELVEDGWDPESVPHLDDDSNTHLWSELHKNCEDEEILIGGPSVDSGAARLFQEYVFGTKSTEMFAVDRPGSFFGSGDDNQALADFLASNDTAISYFDIGHIFTQLDLEMFSLVSIVMEEEVFKPSTKALHDGSYPLSRLIHYFVHNDEESLANSRAFIDFIFSEAGDLATKSSGFWPLSESRKLVMQTRAQSESGIRKSVIEKYCGPAGAPISIAGSSTVYPIAHLWSEIYSSFCDVNITVEGGGSSNGAGRVCGDESRGTPVDIGDMSREWTEEEAEVHNDFIYECLEGDTSRSAIQVDVAIDGLTVVVAREGTATDCIQILGGLTTDQLRWIYSNYNDEELEATGWDPNSVPNSDGNPQTHMWNELHQDCPNVEIRIAGAGDQSGTYEFFLETILADHELGETFDIFRPDFSYFNSEDDDILVDYVFTYPEAISYFGYNYYFENRDSLNAVAVRNSDGVFLKPIPETISDGSYNPLARRIYMNLLNSAEAVENTKQLVKFGLENPKMVTLTGYSPIPEDETNEIVATRLETAPFSLSGDEESSGLSGGAIAGIVLGSLLGLGLIIFIAVKLVSKGKSKDDQLPESSRS